MKARKRFLSFIFLAIVVALACLWLIYASAKGVLSEVEIITAILYTFPLMTISILVIGIRLSLLVGPDVGAVDGIAVNSVAQLVGLMIPSRISEMAKPIGLNLLRGTPAGRGVAALALERTLDASLLAVLTVIATLTGAWGSTSEYSVLLLFGVTCISLAVISTLILYPPIADTILRHVPSEWLRGQIKHGIDAILALRDARKLMLVILLTIATWALSLGVFFAFFAAVGYSELQWSSVLFIFVASTLGLIVSIAPGGLGTFEAAVVMSLVAYNVNFGEAVSLAVLIRICHVLPVIVTASWILFTSRLSVGQIVRKIISSRKRS